MTEDKRNFGQLKADSIESLESIEIMLDNMIKGTTALGYTNPVISASDSLRTITKEMSDIISDDEDSDKESEYIKNESDYLNLLSSIKQTVEGLSGLIEATKEMATSSAPFVDIPSAKIEEEYYTNGPPKIPYIELWGEKSTGETALLYDINGNESTLGSSGIFYLKKSENGRTKPTTDEYETEKNKRTVFINFDNIKAIDENNKDIPKNEYNFILDNLNNSNEQIVEIKTLVTKGKITLYAIVKFYFQYPIENTTKFPKNFFNIKENVGFENLNITTEDELKEISFNLKIVDHRNQ